MSDSNRSDRGALVAQWGGGIVTFIVFLVVTWLVGAQYGQYHGYQEAKSESAANTDANEVQNACAGFAGPELVRCSYEVKKSAEQAQHEQHDLEAQRQTALWTGWMLGASGTGILLTIVGIYFLNANLEEMRSQRLISEGSLKATLSAVEHARDIGKKQMRAYIGIEYGEIRVCRAGKPATVRIRYQNTGATPAKDIRGSFSVSLAPIVDGAIAYPEMKIPQAGSGDLGPGHYEYSERDTEETLTRSNLHDLKLKKLLVVARGTIFYTDVFEDSWGIDYILCESGRSTKDRRMVVMRITERGPI
jgi:hypothetical protein